MTIINMDGLGLIEPGSEWFWTMLQYIALTITFFAIYRQLRTQQVEIREHTKLQRSQAHFNALSLSQRAREVLIETEGFASVINIAYATPEALSDDDWLRCVVYMFMQVNQWEYLYYQHRDGSILVARKPGYARVLVGVPDRVRRTVPVICRPGVRQGASFGRGSGLTT